MNLSDLEKWYARGRIAQEDLLNNARIPFNLERSISVGNICGKGSIFRGPATSSLQEAGPKRSPILGVPFFYFCVHHLTQNDQISRGNTCGTGIFLV